MARSSSQSSFACPEADFGQRFFILALSEAYVDLVTSTALRTSLAFREEVFLPRICFAIGTPTEVNLTSFAKHKTNFCVCGIGICGVEQLGDG